MGARGEKTNELGASYEIVVWAADEVTGNEKQDERQRARTM
jgi:hypothetical protein